jgi:hypothetical protein
MPLTWEELMTLWGEEIALGNLHACVLNRIQIEAVSSLQIVQPVFLIRDGFNLSHFQTAQHMDAVSSQAVQR